MKDQFEKKFMRNFKPGVSQAEAEDGQASADETDMPGFVDQAAQNNRVVPQDDDEDGAEEDGEGNMNDPEETDGTFVQGEANGSHLNVNAAPHESQQSA